MPAATSTAAESPANGDGLTKRKTNAPDTPSENTTPKRKRSRSRNRKRGPPPKYRHVAAVHSETRPSCLSHDSTASPSFLGFRNLMVIVLGESFFRDRRREKLF